MGGRKIKRLEIDTRELQKNQGCAKICQSTADMDSQAPYIQGQEWDVKCRKGATGLLVQGPP